MAITPDDYKNSDEDGARADQDATFKNLDLMNSFISSLLKSAVHEDYILVAYAADKQITISLDNISKQILILYPKMKISLKIETIGLCNAMEQFFQNPDYKCDEIPKNIVKVSSMLCADTFKAKAEFYSKFVSKCYSLPLLSTITDNNDTRSEVIQHFRDIVTQCYQDPLLDNDIVETMSSESSQEILEGLVILIAGCYYSGNLTIA